jgi:hypothetical protein
MPQTLIAPLKFKTAKVTYQVIEPFVINRFNGIALKGWLFDDIIKSESFYKEHEAFKNSLPKLPKYTAPEYVVFKFPYDNTQLYRKCDFLSFTFTLIGDGIQLYKQWVQWFMTIDAIPIGYRNQTGRVAFKQFENVETSTGEDILRSVPVDSKYVNINFLSPAGLKIKDQPWLTPDLPFYLIATAAMERLRLLNFYYTPGNITKSEMNYGIDLKSACDGIMIVNTDLEADAGLFRSKTDKEKNQHHLEGLIGNVTYMGQLHEWLPLIYATEKINLGHYSTWGKGQFILNVQ